MQDGKALIQSCLDQAREELVALSHKIHETPELAYEEYHARDWQVELLRKYGFAVEAPYGGLETAFRASIRTGEGPRLAFLAEYDALPGMGHACGHNIMAASAAGAGLALARAMQACGVAGEVLVIGTPGEESKGGKVHLLDHGAFDNVDFALMMHPGGKNLIGRGGLAAQTLTVKYRGKPAHSAIPEKGINALTPLIALFNTIDMFRQTWPDSARCNGAILSGGKAGNIIPDYAEARFAVRAAKKKQLMTMMDEIRDAARRCARITGAEVELSEELLYAERYPNLVMGELFKANMESLGETMHYPDPTARTGSSDFGNVSMNLPAIHEYLAIAPSSVGGHTEGFCEASRSARADDVVLLAAKGLAMTGWDLAASPEKRAEARKEFEEKALPNRC